MQIIDLIFLMLLLVVQPIYGIFETRYYDARERAGQPFDRVKFYRQTTLVEWLFLVALAAAWLAFGRPIADLGFVTPGGAGFWGGAAFLILLTGYLVYSWQSAKRATDGDKAQLLQSLGKLVRYVPHTARELHSFVGVSITAGIVEEIVYRGFMLWYFGQFMPLWVAVVVTSVAFGLVHSYQGASGVVRTGLAGLAFGIFYVVTGSIWLPIIAHVLLDALQGAAIYRVLGKDDDALEPQPA